MRENFLYLLLVGTQLSLVVSQVIRLDDIPIEHVDARMEFLKEFEYGPWSILPVDDLMKLCPNTDICSTKLSYNVSDDGPACCTGCSCEIDCGLYNNCCFEELDFYQEARQETMPDTCVYPVTNLPVKEKRQPIQSYFMIDQCPGELACDTCGDANVAEWGSLYPVFSQTTGQIYKNKKCADCYNITDGQVWDPYLTVNMDTHESTTVNAGHTLTSQLISSRDMMVRFLPPSEKAIETRACFEELIDSCEHDGIYHIYENMTDMELCMSGLKAPMFYEGDYYSNVFCVYCILHRVNPRNRHCAPRLDSVTGDFVATINKNVTYQHEMLSKKDLACSNDDETCKEVLCPAGRFHYDGECILIQSKWHQTNVQMLLEFSPASIDDHVFRYENDGLDITVSFPDGIGWKLRSTIVEMEETNRIAHLYADFVWGRDNNGHVIPSDVIDEASNLLNQTGCYLEQAGSIYKYGTSISRYAYLGKYLKNNQTSVQPLWFGVKQEMANGEEQGAYNKLTAMRIVTENDLGLDLKGIPISINKLFFCQQIELKEREFVSFYNGTQLYYNKTDTFLFDGEFTLTVPKDGPKVARICLEDSGYSLATGDACCTRTGVLPLLAIMSLAILCGF